MFFRKNNNHCKCHDDLKELQNLIKELDRLKEEKDKLNKPPYFYDYDKKNTSKYISNGRYNIINRCERFYIDVVRLFLNVADGRANTSDFVDVLSKNIMPDNYDVFLKDFGNFLINCVDYRKRIDQINNQISDIEYKIIILKEKLQIR